MRLSQGKKKKNGMISGFNGEMINMSYLSYLEHWYGNAQLPLRNP